MTEAGPESGASRPVPRPAPGRDVVFAVRRTAPVRRRFRWRRWVLTAAAVLAVAAGGWWLTQSGVFSVARVGTGAYRFTDERALRAALAPLLGRNLWALDQADVTEALAPLPWVREVYLRRRLPGSVDLELIEWRPLLVVAETGAPAGAPTLVLVEDGRVLPFPPRLPAPDLPVLAGVLVERSAAGPARLPAATAPAVLELVAALEASGLEAVVPVDFVVARPDGFGIVLQGDEGTLLVGREQFGDRLARYLTAREHLEPGIEVDLRFKDRITVRAPETPGDEEGEDGEAKDGEEKDGEERDGKVTAGDGQGAAAKAGTAAKPAAGARPGGTAKDTRGTHDKAGAVRRPAAKERA